MVKLHGLITHIAFRKIAISIQVVYERIYGNIKTQTYTVHLLVKVNHMFLILFLLPLFFSFPAFHSIHSEPLFFFFFLPIFSLSVLTFNHFFSFIITSPFSLSQVLFRYRWRSFCATFLGQIRHLILHISQFFFFNSSFFPICGAHFHGLIRVMLL